jgi:hypothetical protein
MKTSKLIKLAVMIIVPSMTGFRDPNFETMYPEVGPKTSRIIAKGEWTLPVLIASSLIPTGSGFSLILVSFEIA